MKSISARKQRGMKACGKYQTPGDRVFYRSPPRVRANCRRECISECVGLHPTNARLISEPVIVSTIRRQMGVGPHPGHFPVPDERRRQWQVSWLADQGGLIDLPGVMPVIIVIFR